MIDKAGGRQDAALFRKARADELGKLAGAARGVRYVAATVLSMSAEAQQRRIVQNGRTITSTTISAAATPGISLSKRRPRPDNDRSPEASLLP